MMNITLVPRSILERLIFGKINDQTRFFISDRDYQSITIVGNMAIVFAIFTTILQIFLYQIAIGYAIITGILVGISLMLIYGGHIKAKIIQLHQQFDRDAFLMINALSINMVTTGSFFSSVDNLLQEDMANRYYNKYFKDIIFNANLGKNELQLINEAKEIFLTSKYKEIFSNLNKNIYVYSEPEFLQKIKKKIGIIEDYIVVFIAVSSLFPLSLTFILAMFSKHASISLMLFPFFYGIIGSLILRLMQNKFMVS